MNVAEWDNALQSRVKDGVSSTAIAYLKLYVHYVGEKKKTHLLQESSLNAHSFFTSEISKNTII